MNKKNLILFYSWSGNTKTIAELIHDEIGGGFFEIEPKEAYPEQYSKIVGIGKNEVWNSIKPELLKLPAANYIEFYDNIFIGSPMWWGSLSPCMTSLLSQINIKGKTIIPFITHGGSGIRDSIEELKDLCSESEFLKEFVAYQKGDKSLKENVNAWLKELGVLEA